jgi:hypothetical protein
MGRKEATMDESFAIRAYEHPGETAGQHEARARFVAAVHHVEPEVSRSLMGEALTLYRPIYQAWAAQCPIGEDGRVATPWLAALDDGALLGWDAIQHADPAYSPAGYLDLREALQRWAKRWRLWSTTGDDWCLAAAVETLARMSAEGDDPQPGPLHYRAETLIEMPFSREETSFASNRRGWWPTLESWSDWRKRHKHAPADELADYRARIRAMATAAGLVKPRRDRQRDGNHFAWLAAYVASRATFEEIAERDGVSRQAVAHAVKHRAKQIGLLLPQRQTPIASTSLGRS